tara:strand:+ start:46 stop:681 length:636 start_codon:yes stop_codon:yes gene_type:complete
MSTDQILDISPDENNPNYQIVQFKKRAQISLNTVDIQTLNIKSGMDCNAQLEEEIEKLLEMRKTREAAMKYLAIKDISKKNLSEKLASNGFFFSEEITTELANDGWISDLRVAERISSKGNLKNHSKKKILQTLKNEGIDEYLAIEAIALTLGNASEKDRLIKYAKEEVRKNTNDPKYKIISKLFRKLSLRGWDEEEILDIFYEMGLEMEE